MTLLSLLMTGMVALMVYSLASLRQFLAYNNVQQQINFASRALTTDLMLSDSNGMDTSSAGSCIFATPLGVETAPNAQVFSYVGTNLGFRTWVCYYLSTSGELTRAEQDMTGSFVISSLPARPALATFKALAAPAARVIARQVQQFEVIPAATVGEVQVTVRVAQQVDSTHKTQLTAVTQIKLRN